MSASFYRIKERHEHSHLSMFDARPGAESIKTMMQQASPKISEVQAVERT
jgi:predicted secreted protein